MARVAGSLLVIPFLLVLLLAAAMDITDRRLGSLTSEAFELGPVPIVVMAAVVMIVVFLPLMFLASRLARLSLLSTSIVGLLSALLPVLVGTWSVLMDTRLHWNFRMEQLTDNYPWLIMGALGGLLFWLLAIFRNPAFDRQIKGHS